MAGGAIQDDDELITGINVTPLVDIVLVLLIIFMVTTSYIVNPAIKVDLPKASTAEAVESTTLSVVLTREKGLYLNGDPTEEPALIAAVKAEVAKDKNVQVVIGADKTVSHGQFVRVIDLVKGSGVTKFAINTQPVDPPDQAGTEPDPDDDNEAGSATP